MLSRNQLWLALFFTVMLLPGGCAPAWQSRVSGEVVLQPGRYLQEYYRSPDFDPAAGGYQVEFFPVAEARGLGPGQAGAIFNDELLKAMTANGLAVNKEKPQFIMSGAVNRLTVASSVWRFFSGRGHAELRVAGDIRRGEEVVFAFQDVVTTNPQVHPRHRPTLEPDLIARQAVRRFVTNLLNEMLLPGKRAREELAETPPEGH